MQILIDRLIDWKGGFGNLPWNLAILWRNLPWIFAIVWLKGTKPIEL